MKNSYPPLSFLRNRTQPIAVRFSAVLAIGALASMVGGVAQGQIIGNLVTNGGFEAGNFSGWATSGDVSGLEVTISTRLVYSGSSAATFASFESSGYLTQTVPTTKDQEYVLSFWVLSEFSPNHFSVSWENQFVLDQANFLTAGWTNVQIVVTAAQQASVLEFGGWNFPDFISLDDVSVTRGLPASAPAFTDIRRVANSVEFGWKAGVGRTYQVQSATNLHQPSWADSGTPITATNVVMRAAEPMDAHPQKLLRILLLP